MNIIYPLSYTATDYPDDESFALLIYILGCNNNCVDCQNPQLQDINFISNYTKNITVLDLVKEISNYIQHVNKIVLSGGDPLYYKNIKEVNELCKILKEKNYEITIYTGHNIDYVKQNNFKYFDFIKCNKFNIDLKQQSIKTDHYLQLASSNQEFYDSNYKLLSNNGILYFN